MIIETKLNKIPDAARISGIWENYDQIKIEIKNTNIHSAENI